MTPSEVYDELARDLPNLERWIDRQAKMLRRYSLKTDRRKFPCIMYNEYNSPRKIHYRFIAILYKRNDSFCNFTYTLRQTHNGRELYLCRSYDGSRLPKTVFIPHAIKRYAERMKLDKTGDELIQHMLIHSVDCVSLNDQTLAARSVRYKGEMLKSFCVREGAFLGKQVGDIFMVNTFITYDMMCGRQLEEFSKHREAFERGTDAADEFCVRFNNRKTLQRNQPILKNYGKDKEQRQKDTEGTL